MVRVLERRLLLCFNEVDLDENEVKTIMRMNRSEKTEEEAQKRAGEIYDRLLAAGGIPEALSKGMRDVLEEAYQEMVFNSKMIDHFGHIESEQWATAFEQYATLVPQRMKEFVDKMRTRGDFEQMRGNIKMALQTCHLKAKVLFSYEGDAFYAFPFMSPSVFVTIKTHLARISGVVLEVSLMFVYIDQRPSNCANHALP